MDSAETFWEKRAKATWGSYIREVETRVIKKTKHLNIKPSTALDIGCDGGELAQIIGNMGWQLICTDIRPQAVARCRRRLPEAVCLLVDVNDIQLPCSPNSLGLIQCIEVPFVIQSHWFITEADRVLQPNGVIVGVFPNLLSIRGYYHALAAKLKGQTTTYNVRYPNWRARLRRQGFKILYEEGICWFPFSRHSNSSLVPSATQLEKNLGLRRCAAFSPWIVFLAQKSAN
ncbi:MAG: class I SAM-dependent methyltransferase [Anaerolineae bacterium]|nr:class I SAM-dependent methyltransferase [Anaerolineae bacterium]